ncbi:MAG: hypothetical protein ACYDD4_07125 [Acidimicrobiales bacterium]
MGTVGATRARRAPVVARPAPPRRPPLRVVERPRPAARRRRRRDVHLALAIVVVSLVLVALSQAYLTAGQVRLARIESRITTEQATVRDLELRVAGLENPGTVIGQAEGHGLVVPPQVTDLPLVTSAPSSSGPK